MSVGRESGLPGAQFSLAGGALGTEGQGQGAGALFPCPGCGRVFRWKGSLTNHQRLECGKEPRLLCPYCPHRTKLKGNLRKHVINKHRELFRPEDF